MKQLGLPTLAEDAEKEQPEGYLERCCGENVEDLAQLHVLLDGEQLQRVGERSDTHNQSSAQVLAIEESHLCASHCNDNDEHTVARE
jgi:hypothetical protein